MPGARRGRPEDKIATGRELWTIDGTNTLIRKLQNDPGLSEESREQFIASVRSSALEKGIGDPEAILQYRASKLAKTVIQPLQEVNEPVKSTPKQTVAKTTTSKPDQAQDQFDAYQDFTTETALYPSEVGIAYTTLGLSGESAEVAEKLVISLAKTILSTDGLAVDETRDNLYLLNKLLHSIAKTGKDAEKLKKSLRKGEKKLPQVKALSSDEKNEMAKEIGDILWYCAQLSKCLGFKLSDIAKMNVTKLSSRKARGVLHGNGDNR
jgi:hypothetical protein